MSDSTFIAKDPFEVDVEPEPTPAPLADPTYSVGPAHWFDGDPPFHEVITDLQEQGLLSSSPYALPLPYLSVTQVELYLKCPRQFYFRYIKGEKRPPGIALVAGTTIHKAVEEGYKHVIATETLPELDFVLDTYSGSLDKELTGKEIVWDAKDDDGEDTAGSDPGKLKDQGVELLKKWHKTKLPTVKPRAVEKSFVTSFGGIPIVGRVDLIDRVEDGLIDIDAQVPTPASGIHPLLDTVVDNKVVGKAYTKQKVDSALQMSLYAHATGVPRARYDLFIKSKIPKLSEILTSRDSSQVRWAVQTFVDVARAIAAGVFPPCPPDSFLCCPKWCGYYSKCRGAA